MPLFCWNDLKDENPLAVGHLDSQVKALEISRSLLGLTCDAHGAGSETVLSYSNWMFVGLNLGPVKVFPPLKYLLKIPCVIYGLFYVKDK